jgi:hypothetical protein
MRRPIIDNVLRPALLLFVLAGAGASMVVGGSAHAQPTPGGASASASTSPSGSSASSASAKAEPGSFLDDLVTYEKGRIDTKTEEGETLPKSCTDARSSIVEVLTRRKEGKPIGDDVDLSALIVCQELLAKGKKDGDAILERGVARELDAAKKDAKANPPGAKAPANAQTLTLPTGGELRYGLSLSLLEFDVTRSAREPARLRNYAPRLSFVPGEVGFQFTYRPASQPWRTRANGKPFQLMSWGGMVLVQVSTKELAQGALRLGFTLNFFDEVLGLGVGFDLYRGIPVQGADGSAGGATAYTGLLAAAFAPNGEVTPENVFIVVTLGLEPLVKALTGRFQ